MKWILCLLFCWLNLTGSVCGSQLQLIGGIAFESDELDSIREIVPPKLPPDPSNWVADNLAAAQLGERLFFDKRLSGDGMFSCASCHDPDKSFSDGRKTSQGLHVGRRNTPSLWNVANNRWYFWDGRVATAWSQALKPIEDTNEMGGHRERIAQVITNDFALQAQYAAIFGRNGMNDTSMLFANVGKCIAAFERHIRSGHSRFDQFVADLGSKCSSDPPILTAAELRGLKLFVSRGRCITCHYGPELSDNEFHDILLPGPQGHFPDDPGRFGGIATLAADEFSPSSRYSDCPKGSAAESVHFVRKGVDAWGRFKTPTLRNVALTAPYMHAGQYESLEQVIEHYSSMSDAIKIEHHNEEVVVPLNFSASEKIDLIQFLGTLTDENKTWDIAHLFRNNDYVTNTTP